MSTINNNDYRIEKDRLAAVVVTVGGERLTGELFVQASPRNRYGREEAADVLNLSVAATTRPVPPSALSPASSHRVQGRAIAVPGTTRMPAQVRLRSLSQPAAYDAITAIASNGTFTFTGVTPGGYDVNILDWPVPAGRSFNFEAPGDVTGLEVKGLMRFEPCGHGNPKPVLLSRGVKVARTKVVGHTGEHLHLLVKDGPLTWPAIAFRQAENELADEIDLVYSFSREWGGDQLKLEVLDFAPAAEQRPLESRP